MLRALFLAKELAGSPQGSKCSEQLTRELTDALRELSQQRALEGSEGEWTIRLTSECWELPRLVLTTTARESGYWPTPTADSVTERTQRYAQGGMPLTAAVRMFPTATAYKGWSPNHNRADSDDRLDYTVEREAFMLGQTTPPKRLNPDWVEWLIGWPIGHTALKPLETDRFREWQRQHGGCSMSGEVDPNWPREKPATRASGVIRATR